MSQVCLGTLGRQWVVRSVSRARRQVRVRGSRCSRSSGDDLSMGSNLRTQVISGNWSMSLSIWRTL